MDYQKHYLALMARADGRELVGYVERHHVIPKCMDHDSTDKVRLTPEEHFVAHQLLVKMFPGNQPLVKALSMMSCGGESHLRNNRMYGWIRRKVQGVPRTAVEKANISRGVRASMLPEDHDKRCARVAAAMTPEVRARISASVKLAQSDPRLRARAGAGIKAAHAVRKAAGLPSGRPKGTPMSLEERARRQGLGGWKHSEASKQKRAASLKARWADPEFRAKMVAASLTPEAIARSSAASNKRWRNEVQA